jgi:hypothetical protein
MINYKKVSFPTILACMFTSHFVMANDINATEHSYDASLSDHLGLINKMSGTFRKGRPTYFSSSNITDDGEKVKDSMTLNYTADGKFVFSVENKGCGSALYESNKLPSVAVSLKSEHGCTVDLSVGLSLEKNQSEKLLSGNVVAHEYVKSVEVTKGVYKTGEGIYLLNDGTCEKRTSALVSQGEVTTADGYSIDTLNVSLESRTVECPS